MSPQNPNTLRTKNLTPTSHKSKPSPQTLTEKTSRAIARIPRHEADRLLILADFLPPHDAVLIREVLGAGRSIAHVARLLGASRHRLRRRLDSLLARTASPAFLYVVSRRIHTAAAESGRRLVLRASARDSADRPGRWPADWSEPMRTAAQLCIIEGLSCRRASARSTITFHVLRRHVALLHELGAAWKQLRPHLASDRAGAAA